MKLCESLCLGAFVAIPYTIATKTPSH